MAEGNAAYRV